MNKILRLSLIALLTVFCGGGVFAQVKLDFGVLYGEATISDISSTPKTVSGITVSFAKGNSPTAPAYNKSKEIRLYGGKSNTILDGNSMTVKSASGNMTNIVLTHGSSCTWGTITANVGNITVNADKDVTWVGNAEEVVFTISRNESAVATSTQYRITSATVTCGSSSKGLANLKFSEDKITIKQGDSFTAPTFTKSTTADVTFASDNEGVATVNAEGVISLGTEIGTAVITATAAENDDYNAGTATCTIKVLPAVATEVTLPYEETFADAIGSFTIDDVNLGEGLTYVWKHDTEYKYMKASAYNKKNIASESWLVSPTINLNGISTATLSFEQCISKYFGTVSEEATLWVKEEGGAWQQITITYPEIPDGKNWSAMEKHSDISLDDYAGEKIKIGFKYVSTDAAAGTWEIKNFKVTGVATNINGITENAANENAPIYNLAGQRVNKTAKGILIQNGKKFMNK